jgi:hypothetical protein
MDVALATPCWEISVLSGAFSGAENRQRGVELREQQTVRRELPIASEDRKGPDLRSFVVVNGVRPSWRQNIEGVAPGLRGGRGGWRGHTFVLSGGWRGHTFVLSSEGASEPSSRAVFAPHRSTALLLWASKWGLLTALGAAMPLIAADGHRSP